MSHPGERPPPAPIPPWAWQQATDELYDVEDVDVITLRARDIVGERQQRDDERHDEYDDPDEGGEA